MIRCLVALLILLTQTAFAQPEKVLEEWKKDKVLKGASYGFAVTEAATGSLVSGFNASLSLIPASTLKIFCTAAALKELGKDFRFETKIVMSGTLDKKSGELNGDIIIEGSGDPSLQSDLFSKEQLTDKWAAALKEKGIVHISGNIIGEASYPSIPHPSWLWEDVSNYYGAAPCGLNYMDNKFALSYTTGDKGSKATLNSTAPNYASKSFSISSEVYATGTQDEAYVYGNPNSFEKNVRGTLPPNKKDYQIEASLPDPALLCAEHLLASLKKAGIKCDGIAISNYEKLNSSSQILHTHYSPPLEKLVYFTNQMSNNLYCESLLRAMGKGDEQKGRSIIKKVIAQSGLDTTDLFQVDACGLSRLDACTPQLEAQFLQKISKDPLIYPLFLNSLPLAGRSSNMANFGKGTSLENNLHCKSGYMTRARAYCGYLKAKSGRELSFSVIINNYNCSAKEIKQRLEKFLLALAEL